MGSYELEGLTTELLGVKAGNAAAMESKLYELLTGDTAPAAIQIQDMVLAGVGEGPEWEALLIAAPSTDAGLVRATARAAAAVAGSREEVYLRLQQRLAELNDETPFTVVGKVEVAGGGDGSSFMALAIVGETAV